MPQQKRASKASGASCDWPPHPRCRMEPRVPIQCQQRSVTHLMTAPDSSTLLPTGSLGPHGNRGGHLPGPHTWWGINRMSHTTTGAPSDLGHAHGGAPTGWATQPWEHQTVLVEHHHCEPHNQQHGGGGPHTMITEHPITRVQLHFKIMVDVVEVDSSGTSSWMMSSSGQSPRPASSSLCPACPSRLQSVHPAG